MADEIRIVMITGAAGNLGRAVAKAFADAGDVLVLLGRSKDTLARAFGQETPRTVFAAADLLAQDQVGATVQMALDRFGRVDVLCNLAGGFAMGEPVHAASDATWQAMYDLNCRTALIASRAVVPTMLKQRRGKIVNIGAVSALKGAAHMAPYVASKAALMRLTESMAMELRDEGINVNCVLPSIIDTAENRAATTLSASP